MSHKPYCEKVVFRSGGPWRGSRCSNKGKVQVNGKWFCGIHSPEAETRRIEKRQARYAIKTERWERQAELQKLQKAAVNFFESNDGRAIATDKIEPGGFWMALDVISQLRAAMDDLTNQLPKDEWLADYNLDLAESAEDSACALLDRMGVK